MPLENTMDRPWRNLYEDISNLRFRINIEDNPFQLLSGGHNPILPTFPMWESIDDVYYYNILKNKGLVKRKVTFRQSITIPSSNLLSGRLPSYQTRYQTRSNNSPEESSDDDDDDNDNNSD